jgi:ABC-type phosphate transport system substrate-binding protein
MKSFFLKISLACVLLLAGVLPAAAALDGVAIIANQSVPVNSISAADLKNIYVGRTMYWEDGQSVGIILLADEMGGDKTDAALNEVSGMNASQFRTFWQRMVFSGRGRQPRKADDAASLVALVASTKGAIALVPADADLKGVKIIEVN